VVDWGANSWLTEELKSSWQHDATSVPAIWGTYFSQHNQPSSAAVPQPAAPVVPAVVPPAVLVVPPAVSAVPPAVPDGATPLRGVAAAIAKNMASSLSVPTATSTRTVETAALEAARASFNASHHGLKATFGHLITYAIVQAAAKSPMLRTFHAGSVLTHAHVNVGVAVDVNGSLMVPVIHAADQLSFESFVAAYDAVVAKAQAKQLSVVEMQGATISVTNPGGIGTTLSVPRLMEGQAAIIGVGAITLPYGFKTTDPAVIAQLGISRVCTLTSTYDHRVIQGADSGRFLRTIDELLQGAHDFYSALAATSEPSVAAPSPTDAPVNTALPEDPGRQLRLQRWQNAWFELGHTIADLNPLTDAPTLREELTLAWYGLENDPEAVALEPLLHSTYGGRCALQAAHLEPQQRDWVQAAFQTRTTTRDELVEAASRTATAAAFEQFLARKYVGQKRFGLEGLETLIPLLDAVMAGAPRAFIGMPHRGRLNVLCNITNKPFEKLLAGFEGQAHGARFGAGDVKYHLGHTGEHNGTVVTVAENPSHLETVAPVVAGLARAHQDATKEDALAVIMHGDASAAGQGVVWETLALAKLDAYDIGGSIHIIADNHVGFTTSSSTSRAQRHSSDSMRGFNVPILHANADDLEAVLHVARVAVAWRHEFRTDVVIRLSGYRRNGHNEGDDASYTQPREHTTIQAHPTITAVLQAAGLPTDGTATTQAMQTALDKVRATPYSLEIDPSSLPTAVIAHAAVTHEQLATVRAALDATPIGFTVHPKLAKQLVARSKMLDEGFVDWAAAELLAFGTIALGGIPVRLAGEDSQRGTFAHRHAALIDVHTGEHHIPLQLVGDVQVWNTLLSEYAALGFEYGYQLGRHDALVMWEGQFGDFANVAQVIIDQYIAAGEDKWAHHNGIVLMLPHGFEGQGPEHSSARLERFLQLAANGSMRICAPTTAAQWFHLLHEQAASTPRRPLIVMSPKQPLRMSQTRSSLAALVTGSFRPVIDDQAAPVVPKRVVVCAGKVAWDLIARRDDTGSQTAIIRLEQLHPLPDELFDTIDAYDGAELVWAQEEPLNQGAWRYIQGQCADRGVLIKGVGRAERSSPATGLKAVHDVELEMILTAALHQ
jgi:2-oxoglutarate decarboxylase